MSSFGYQILGFGGAAANLPPEWTTNSGTLGTIMYGQYATTTYTVEATDPEGETISYAVKSGSALPSGMSINSSSGVISGTVSDPGSNTTTDFTLEATAGGKTTERDFAIIVNTTTTTAISAQSSLYTWTAPTGITLVEVYMWGAGGGGGSNNGPWSYSSPGGGGGAAYGKITVVPGTDYYIVVGQGGPLAPGGGNQYASKYGYGGIHANVSADANYGGGGGGLAGFFTGSTPSQANAKLVAGGGGSGGASRASGATTSSGGAGGGADGVDGSSYTSSYGGNKGTQSAGGASGSTEDQGGLGAPNNGSGVALYGGWPTGWNAGGQSYPDNPYGGGGGAGYYGGGGGTYNEPNNMGGGGGGSGFVAGSGVASSTLYTGSGKTPGNSGNGNRSGAGDGGLSENEAGGPTVGDGGRVVLLF